MKSNEFILLSLFREVQWIKAILQKGRIHLFQNEWLDGNQVIEILKISPRTLQALRDSRALPFSKVRNKLYYRLSDLEKLMEDNLQYKRPKSNNYGR